MKFVRVPVLRTQEDHDFAARRLAFFLRPTYDGPRRDPDEIRALATALQDYERVKFPSRRFKDPIEAIRFRMEQLGIVPSDLIPIVGSAALVSRLLSRQQMSLRTIRKLHKSLDIPADALILPLRRRGRKPKAA